MVLPKQFIRRGFHIFLVVVAVTDMWMVDAFVPTPNSKHSTATTPLVYQRSMLQPTFRLAMTNMTRSTGGDDSSEMPSPLEAVKKGWDMFFSSSAYRTFLFTGALLSSKSLREFLGIPGGLAIVIGTLAIFSYETKFNYLVDVVTPRRQAALKAVRQAKTDRLLGVSSHSEENEDLQVLLDRYETTLREELQTRVIVPPSLWVIEMDPTQEDWATAPQLLGMEISDRYTLESVQSKRKD